MYDYTKSFNNVKLGLEIFGVQVLIYNNDNIYLLVKINIPQFKIFVMMKELQTHLEYIYLYIGMINFGNFTGLVRNIQEKSLMCK